MISQLLSKLAFPSKTPVCSIRLRMLLGTKAVNRQIWEFNLVHHLLEGPDRPLGATMMVTLTSNPSTCKSLSRSPKKITQQFWKKITTKNWRETKNWYAQMIILKTSLFKRLSSTILIKMTLWYFSARYSLRTKTLWSMKTCTSGSLIRQSSTNKSRNKVMKVKVKIPSILTRFTYPCTANSPTFIYLS